MQSSSKNFYKQTVLWAIYPPGIFALILFPFITGLFINYQLVDFRELLISLVWISFFTIPYFLSHKRFFYYLCASLCFINGFVNLVHWIMIKGPVSASSLFVLFNTNYQEAEGFFHLKSSYEYLLLIPYLILFLLTLRFPFYPSAAKGKKGHYIAALIGIIAIAFVAENAYHGRLIRKGTPVLLKASVSFYQEVKAYKELKKNKGFARKDVKAIVLPLSNPQVYVLILGESANRNHMSLYGYYRETNPLLKKFKNLIVYDNVVSAYSHTLESIPASLSQANLENHLKPYASVNLIEIFRAAGFRTYWISNQSPLGVWDNLITLLAQQSDITQFVNVSGSSSFESNYKTSWDSKLFKPFVTALNENAARKFIILHLMGSHSTYSKRYPPAFNVFKDGSSEKNKTIAAYDNSILYNDYVVDSLMRIVRAYSEKNDAVSAVIYLSDHGENVYDEADYAGHDYSVKMPRSNVEIPFLIWLSPAYKNTFPTKSMLIEKHRHEPFVSDDLFHAVIDLSGVKTKTFEPQRSVFNQAFNDKRKRILVDGKDYDKP